MLSLLLALLLAAPQGAPLVTLSVPLDTGVEASHSAGIATGVAHHDPVGQGGWTVSGVRDTLGWSAPANFSKARRTPST